MELVLRSSRGSWVPVRREALGLWRWLGPAQQRRTVSHTAPRTLLQPHSGCASTTELGSGSLSPPSLPPLTWALRPRLTKVQMGL